MDHIDIRIDFGSAQLTIGGQTVTGKARAKIAIDRFGLAQLIAGGPLPLPAPVSAEPAFDPFVFHPLPHIPATREDAPVTEEEVEAPVAPAAEPVADEIVEPIIEQPAEAEPVAPLVEEVVAIAEALIVPAIVAAPVVGEVVPAVKTVADAAVTVAPVRTAKLAPYSDDELRSAITESIARGAEKLGVSYQVLYAGLKLRGIPTKPVSKQPVVQDSRPQLTDISDNAMRDLLQSGRTWEAIAEDYGVDLQRINKEARRLNVAKPTSEVARSFADLTFRR